MTVPAPPYVGRLHGVLAVLPSTRIARSLERIEMSLGCARCGACVVTLLVGASAAPAERERAGGAGSAGLGRGMRPGVARIARRSCALVGTPTRSHPQRGPLFRAPASLAVIRTWRNARRRTYAELPYGCGPGLRTRSVSRSELRPGRSRTQYPALDWGS
jgi:hypothetical protein